MIKIVSSPSYLKYALQKNKKSARKTPSSSFSISPQESEVSSPQDTSAPLSLQPLAALNQWQGDGANQSYDLSEKDLSYAHGLLNDLNEFKHDLLTGKINITLLNQVIKTIENRSSNPTKYKHPLIEEVEIRARVEVAKYSQTRLNYKDLA